VAKRVPKGIVCLLTALRFHGLGTQHPREVWLAVDRRAGIPRIDFTPARIVRISGELRPLALTPGDRAALVAFLRALTSTMAR
jgi:predicted transcriptional regulator of viral defense system